MKLIAPLLFFSAISVLGQAPPRSIVQATGTASVAVTPDQAQITVSAITQSANAQDAANQNATIAANIQSQVAQVLGSSGTVKTIGYSVTPNYNYPQGGSPILTGYTVTNTIQVVLNDLSIAGKLLDTATQSGASRIDGLQFTLKDDTDARSQALRAATVKAKAKADAMASSAGLKTGSFLTIQEAGVAVPVVVTAVGATSTPIQPGQLSVTANVTVAVEMVQ